MNKKLDINLFGGHNADEFPLDQVIDFADERQIGYRDWSSSMECDFCDTKGLHYYRETVVYYNKDTGFRLSEDDDTDDDEVDFAVYYCPECKKWVTYIE